MERNLKHISQELKLPQESRDRIRSQLVSYQTEDEDVPIKKATLKRRVPLIIAAAVMVTALTLTAAAVVTHQFRNDIIISSKADIPKPSDKNVPYSYGVTVPGSRPSTPLDEMIEKARFKSDDWPVGMKIGGGAGVEGYALWDFVEVLSNDPVLRSRRVGRADGAEKMEYTAENPTNLLDTLTGRIMVNLTWMNDHYEYVPDANLSFTVVDKKGNYVSELFEALYTKPDDSGYVRIEFYNRAKEKKESNTYIIDGSFETAYYHTTPDGFEFVVCIDKGRVWADCNTNHAHISLYGVNLTNDEIEDILDNLSLSIGEQ